MRLLRHETASHSRELDFVALLPDRTRLLVQVCESLALPATRKRELSALLEAMKELESREGIIVTRNEEEMIERDGRTIRVVSAWKWLLEIDAAAGQIYILQKVTS